ncbi:MAG: hypothetical protein HGA45_37775 [Chloroflexales bacterium]|nr:hypothetical protein [Chloroflexales bacterium]
MRAADINARSPRTTIALCREDPLVSLVHDLFGANIVRVPDARVQPLSVVVHRGGRSFFRGSLLPLLADARPLGIRPEESDLTDISGRRSRRVTLDLGVHILRGFLQGLGLPHADLTAGLEGAAYLSFAFPSARRLALDINSLGWALAERRIDRGNPAAAILFEQPRYELLLVDSVLTSRQIAVVLSGARGQRLNIDVAALRQTLTELGGSVGATSDRDIELNLSSEADLTFAFSCVRLTFDAEGAILAIPPDHDTRTLSDLAPDRVRLSDGPGLLVWDG